MGFSDACGQLVPGQVPAGPPVTCAVRSTLPSNPFRLSRVIVEVVAGAPGRKDRVPGLAETVKSRTLTVTLTEWDNTPLVPVTVTV